MKTLKENQLFYFVALKQCPVRL